MPKIYYNDVKFRLGKTRDIKEIIEKVIRLEGRKTGDLFFIFTGDEGILEINREFLNHDYETDVITFDYSDERFVNGEIYIGIDTVKKNSEIYSVVFREEVLRVMIHGVLHLLGYYDATDEEKREMREKEDKYIQLYRDIDEL